MKTRFAPSPTGPLHLGHAYSAMLAHEIAQAAQGTFMLRIEDIDRSRARPVWEAQIYDDLQWLGLDWPTPVMRQSDRSRVYQDRLAWLWSEGLAYACTCTRRDIMAAVAAPQEGGLHIMGPDGLVYPGTCRPDVANGPQPDNAALRLDMGKSLDLIAADDFSFTETGSGQPVQTTFSADDVLTTIGDIVLSRRDMGTSYHLSVVIDDAAQDVSDVVRGRDLFEATKIHVVLQKLLGLPTPTYHHHKLIRDDAGKRLAKRDDARAIAKYREDGASPADIRSMVGL
ncbi:tRNA glutamyl-Q(34) synthetase GluQRS [Pseudooctadecabacter sp.]|uniref:tRNA glutamyl-Q(34) synthetase GluQRS n=1 Tax=Pseudooctadecabacter sp. TaxID=1966338 RepID=UPI0035C8175D